jgi:hypothetical protein
MGEMSETDPTTDLRSHATASTSAFLEAIQRQAETTERLLVRMNAVERRLDALAPEEPEPVPTNGSVDAAIAQEAVPSWLEEPAGSRWRKGVGRLVPHVSRTCAVCDRHAPRRGKRELARYGWSISGASNLCPDCIAAGWHVSPSGGVPFRRPRPSAT